MWVEFLMAGEPLFASCGRICPTVQVPFIMWTQWPGRRRDCHFADTPSPSLLKHLLNVEGGCSRVAVSPPAAVAVRELRAPEHALAALRHVVLRRGGLADGDRWTTGWGGVQPDGASFC